MKLFEWLQEYSLGIYEHLSLRIATKIVLASILAWGMANFFTVSNEVHILKQQQSNRFAEKSTRLTEIIQTAEVALSLGHDDAADEESIYKGYDADLHNNLVDQYRLSYSLVIPPFLMGL